MLLHKPHALEKCMLAVSKVKFYQNYLDVHLYISPNLDGKAIDIVQKNTNLYRYLLSKSKIRRTPKIRFIQCND